MPGKRSSRRKRDDAPRQAPPAAKQEAARPPPKEPAAEAPPRPRILAAPHEDIARLALPFWTRAVLTLCAALYLVLLVFHQFRHKAWPDWMKPPMMFINSTELFPTADRYATEFKLEGWSCTDKKWEPMDPRPYFPLHGDDKESRFQRILHFYLEDARDTHSRYLRPVMHAMERYFLDGHGDGADDGVAGPLGGIKVYEMLTPIPSVGDDVARYEYQPLVPAPPTSERYQVFETPPKHRDQQCPTGRFVDYPVKPDDAAPAEDD